MGLAHERAYFYEALLHAFEERGVDVSAVSDGTNISFEHRIHFDTETYSLQIVE